MGCSFSQLTEPTIYFEFSKDEDGNEIFVDEFTKYIIRLESESFAIEKDNTNPAVEMNAETNSLSIFLTQEETMKFDPNENIQMQIYFEIDGVPNVTNIKVTNIREVLNFEGVVL